MWLAGDTYRCATQSGAFSYFNVPGSNGSPPSSASISSSPKAPTPAAFPRVDPETQKGRDGVRRKVLATSCPRREAAGGVALGLRGRRAPGRCPKRKPMPRSIACASRALKQSVSVHEKNVEALKKELATVK
jgi:hypothetical protein